MTMYDNCPFRFARNITVVIIVTMIFQQITVHEFAPVSRKRRDSLELLGTLTQVESNFEDNRDMFKDPGILSMNIGFRKRREAVTTSVALVPMSPTVNETTPNPLTITTTTIQTDTTPEASTATSTTSSNDTSSDQQIITTTTTTATSATSSKDTTSDQQMTTTTTTTATSATYSSDATSDQPMTTATTSSTSINTTPDPSTAATTTSSNDTTSDQPTITTTTRSASSDTVPDPSTSATTTSSKDTTSDQPTTTSTTKSSSNDTPPDPSTAATTNSSTDTASVQPITTTTTRSDSNDTAPDPLTAATTTALNDTTSNSSTIPIPTISLFSNDTILAPSTNTSDPTSSTTMIETSTTNVRPQKPLHAITQPTIEDKGDSNLPPCEKDQTCKDTCHCIAPRWCNPVHQKCAFKECDGATWGLECDRSCVDPNCASCHMNDGKVCFKCSNGHIPSQSNSTLHECPSIKPAADNKKAAVQTLVWALLASVLCAFVCLKLVKVDNWRCRRAGATSKSQTTSLTKTESAENNKQSRETGDTNEKDMKALATNDGMDGVVKAENQVETEADEEVLDGSKQHPPPRNKDSLIGRVLTGLWGAGGEAPTIDVTHAEESVDDGASGASGSGGGGGGGGLKAKGSTQDASPMADTSATLPTTSSHVGQRHLSVPVVPVASGGVTFDLPEGHRGERDPPEGNTGAGNLEGSRTMVTADSMVSEDWTQSDSSVDVRPDPGEDIDEPVIDLHVKDSLHVTHSHERRRSKSVASAHEFPEVVQDRNKPDLSLKTSAVGTAVSKDTFVSAEEPAVVKETTPSNEKEASSSNDKEASSSNEGTTVKSYRERFFSFFSR